MQVLYCMTLLVFGKNRPKNFRKLHNSTTIVCYAMFRNQKKEALCAPALFSRQPGTASLSAGPASQASGLAANGTLAAPQLSRNAPLRAALPPQKLCRLN